MIRNLTMECYYCGSDHISVVPCAPVHNGIGMNLEIIGKPRCGVCGGSLIIYNHVPLILDITEPTPEDDDDECCP